MWSRSRQCDQRLSIANYMLGMSKKGPNYRKILQESAVFVLIWPWAARDQDCRKAHRTFGMGNVMVKHLSPLKIFGGSCGWACGLIDENSKRMGAARFGHRIPGTVPGLPHPPSSRAPRGGANDETRAPTWRRHTSFAPSF